MIIQETYVDDNGVIYDNLCRTYSDQGVYISPSDASDVLYESAIDPKEYIPKFNKQNLRGVKMREYVETSIVIEYNTYNEDEENEEGTEGADGADGDIE